MKDLEYRVPSPHYLRLSMGDRTLCLKTYNDPILTSTRLQPSESDEAIKTELNEAKSAIEWQSKRTLGKKLSSAILSDEDTSSSSSEEEEGKEEKDFHTESPKMRGVHGAFASKWLHHHFVVQPDNSFSRGEIYRAYIIHCEKNNITHCNPAIFGKVLRTVFPDIKTKRIGTRGKSRYHYCGIGIKPRAAKRQSESHNDRINEIHDGITSICKESNILLEHSQELLPLLQNFPTCQDLGLPESENQVLEEFLNLTYRWHAVRVLDCILRAEFYQVKDIIGEFWGSVPAPTLSLLSVPLVLAAIERCDQIVYRIISDILLPHVLTPLPTGLMLTLKNFVKNLLHWHEDGLTYIPSVIKHAKVKACHQFKTSFTRRIQINHMSVTASTVIDSGDIAGMIRGGWHLLQQSFRDNPSLYHVSQDLASTDLVSQFLQEYGHLWDTSSSLLQHLYWVEGVVLKSMEKITRLSQKESRVRQELIRQFVLEWTFICSQILKVLTFISPAALGPLQLLDMLYRDYMLFLLERWNIHC
ncbi:transcription factor RFX4-like [Ostrea edulis]|uniref:transcription factor RFX4-like n=1 Tax=Ostrea edulis TaxID=37623 RepID=UPI0024AEE407|nr:transcription factor RFX4-like [Ostrea edulis]